MGLAATVFLYQNLQLLPGSALINSCSLQVPETSMSPASLGLKPATISPPSSASGLSAIPLSSLNPASTFGNNPSFSSLWPLKCASISWRNVKPFSEPQFLHPWNGIASAQLTLQRLPQGQSGPWMRKSLGEKQKVQSATQEPGISVINKSQIGLLHPPRHPPPLSRPLTLPRLSLAGLLPWVMFPLKPPSIPPPALHLRVCRGMKCPANISVFTLKYKDNYTSRSNSRLCICYQVLRALFWKAIMPMWFPSKPFLRILFWQEGIKGLKLIA